MADYSTYSDAGLLHLIQSNNKLAFTELYNRYWQRLFAIASVKLSHSAEAEELVQDLFYDLWKRRHDISIRTSISSYLSVALNYRVINIKARRHRQELFYKTALYETNTIDNGTENFLRFEELQERLHGLVNQLPERCRLIFQMSREQGLTRATIGRELGIAEKTVEVQLTKALKHIRKGLGACAGLFTILNEL